MVARMWVRVNLSSLPAELYPQIPSAIADSFRIITANGRFVKRFFGFSECFCNFSVAVPENSGENSTIGSFKPQKRRQKLSFCRRRFNRIKVTLARSGALNAYRYESGVTGSGSLGTVSTLFLVSRSTKGQISTIVEIRKFSSGNTFCCSGSKNLAPSVVFRASMRAGMSSRGRSS